MKFLKRKEILIRIVIIVISLIVIRNLYITYNEKKSFLKQMMEEEKQKNTLLIELDSLKKAFSKYQELSLKKPDFSFITDELKKIANSKEAKDIKVKVLSLEPQRLEEKKFYSNLPLRIILEGNYHEIGKTISLLENWHRFVGIIENLKILSIEDKDKVKTEIMLTNIWIKD